MRKKAFITILMFLFILFSGFVARAVDPVVTVRFANPKYTCSTQTYKLDVEFQCDTPDKQLFGMNVRFFYPDNLLEFISFGDYVTGYATFGSVSYSSINVGMPYFGFPGYADFINGAIQKTGTTSLTLSTTGWTRIFSVSFHVDDPNAIDTNNFCPSAIWCLNQAATTGFGSAPMICITIVNGNNTAQTTEHCVQFNWQYDAPPDPPYGSPICTNGISTLGAYAPKTYLHDYIFNAPGSVDVPVTVTNFTKIGHLHLVFEYDPAIMTYVDNSPNAIFTTSTGLLNVNDSASTNGKHKITMDFQRLGNTALTLCDNAHLTDLHFNYISGTTDLSWKTLNGTCHYVDSLLVPKCDYPNCDYYLNGSASTLLAPVTKIDSAMAVTGDYVTYAVRVWDFNDIHSGFLTLNYDPDVLIYFDAVPNAAISDSFDVDAYEPGTCEMHWSSTTISLPDSSVLIYLTFEYLGGAAPLLWYDEDGTSCQYTNCNGLPLYDDPSENFYINGNVTNAEFIWTGEYSGDWNNPANWENNIIPDQFTNVTINPLTDPMNWPTFNGDFTLGDECKNLTLSENAQFSILGNLTINPGHALNFNSSGTLHIEGDWINSGIFNAGVGTVEFTGAENAIIGQGVPPGNYVAGYLLSTFTPGMNAINGGSAGPTGDDAHSDVNIGFTFKYLGINYTQIRINTNGWLSFNLSGNDITSHDNTLLFDTPDPTTVLAPWWDDLKADANTTIKYLVEGTAPARVLTVEWKNILSYSSDADVRLDFQVKLYESTNIIEFCYGNVTSGEHNNAESASIGIKDATGGPGNFLEATHNSTNLIIAFLKSVGNWPTVNYRFSPPSENTMEVFYNLVVSKAPGTLDIQQDVIVTGLQ